MARRKKARRVSRRSRSRTVSGRRRKSALRFEIDKKVSREILGVFWVAFAALNFLTIQGSAGPFGIWWKESVLAPFLGVGTPVFPLACVVIGISYLMFHEMRFQGARVAGMFILTASVLGIVSLQVPVENLFDVSREYGGYIGFVTTFLLVSAFGQTASFFLMLSGAIISVFLILQVSLHDFFEAIVSFARSTHEGAVEIRDQIQKTRLHTLKEPDAPANRKKNDVSGDELDEEVVIVRGIEQAIERAATEQVVPAASGKSPEITAVTKPVIQDNTKFSTDKEAYMSHDYADWKFPSLELLAPQLARSEQDDKKLLDDADTIRKKLSQFGIEVGMKDIHVGPTVIQYTLKPAEDVKLSKITALKNDLALALAARAIRIEAPVPGKSLVGIEIPTAERATVVLKDILESSEFNRSKDDLKLVLGRDVTGKPIYAPLTKMPHLLVAGQTGSGKSVAINAFLITLLYQHSPADLKMIMIDPKRVELSGYNGIPHLLTPVVTEPDKALKALKWAVAEMTRRYKELSHRRKRNIVEYNADKELEHMPYIVVVIDELADLMMAASKEIEATICRLAQMARAVGIHLIIATQRPSVDVITGLIKANVPTRIAFTVATGVDSRTILDSIGAEDLLNKGDMLYLASDLGKPMRVQGVYVGSDEIERVINHIKLNAPEAVEYLEEITEGDHKISIPGLAEKSAGGGEGDQDDLQKAIDVIKQHRKASASLLQRRCGFGYAKAARVLDELEEMGMIGPVNGAKPREIFIQE